MGIGPLAIMILAELDQKTRLQAMRQGFESSPAVDGDQANTVLSLLVIGVTVIGMAAMLLQMLQRDRRGGHGSRGQHLRQAIRVLALKPDEAATVHTVASRARLAQPTAMLLSPANLAHAEREARKRKDDKELRGKLDRLSAKLFGKPLPTEEDA